MNDEKYDEVLNTPKAEKKVKATTEAANGEKKTPSKKASSDSETLKEAEEHDTSSDKNIKREDKKVSESSDNAEENDDQAESKIQGTFERLQLSMREITFKGMQPDRLKSLSKPQTKNLEKTEADDFPRPTNIKQYAQTVREEAETEAEAFRRHFNPTKEEQAQESKNLWKTYKALSREPTQEETTELRKACRENNLSGSETLKAELRHLKDLRHPTGELTRKNLTGKESNPNSLFYSPERTFKEAHGLNTYSPKGNNRFDKRLATQESSSESEHSDDEAREENACCLM